MVNGGRCVLGAKETRGHATEVETAVDLSASTFPFQAAEKDKESTTQFEKYTTKQPFSSRLFVFEPFTHVLHTLGGD